MEKSGLLERRKSGVRVISACDALRETSEVPALERAAAKKRLRKNPAFFRPGTKKPLALEKMIPVPQKTRDEPLAEKPPSTAEVVSELMAKAAAGLQKRSPSV